MAVIKCNMSWDLINLWKKKIDNKNITKINKLGLNENITRLSANENQIDNVDFLNILSLNNLIYLSFLQNNISIFKPALPFNALINLVLRYNLINEFEIVAPNLSIVDLENNQISDLSNISLSNNINLTIFSVSYNQISDYSIMETWANNLPVFENPCIFQFNGNPANPIGTTFEAILLTKNVTCQY